MPQTYTPEFKKKIVRLHLEEGRTMKSITAEFGVSKAGISKWCSEFSEECQEQAKANPDNKTELELMQENRKHSITSTFRTISIHEIIPPNTFRSNRAIRAIRLIWP